MDSLGAKRTGRGDEVVVVGTDQCGFEVFAHLLGQGAAEGERFSGGFNELASVVFENHEKH